jgi:hypothetical protein
VVPYKHATWMLPVLRDAGVQVKTVSGWESRGRPPSTGGFDPYAVGNHHTGTSAPGAHPSLGLVTRGRSDLPGPLAQLFLARTGVAWLVAAGRANHAGVSSGPGKLKPGDGNWQMIGIEVETSGNEELTKDQWASLPLINAALLKHMGNSHLYSFLHETWSITGKWDLAENGRTIDLGEFRDKVRAQINALSPPPRPKPTLPTVNLSRLVDAFAIDSQHQRNPGSEGRYPKGVKLVEGALADIGFLSKRYAADGYAGPTTVAAYKQLQRSMGYRGQDADGIPGMTSLVTLGARDKRFQVVA